MLCNTVGRPSELTDEVKARILAAVPDVLIQAQIAKRAKIPKQTLNTWLMRGLSDKKEGNDTIYAQFSDEYYYSLTEEIKRILDQLKTSPKSFGALTWILERCFREDFGAESEEIRQLKELFKQAFPHLMEKGDAHGNKADPHFD